MRFIQVLLGAGNICGGDAAESDREIEGPGNRALLRGIDGLGVFDTGGFPPPVGDVQQELGQHNVGRVQKSRAREGPSIFGC